MNHNQTISWQQFVPPLTFLLHAKLQKFGKLHVAEVAIFSKAAYNLTSFRPIIFKKNFHQLIMHSLNLVIKIEH